jgi:hypothetical protein
MSLLANKFNLNKNLSISEDSESSLSYVKLGTSDSKSTSFNSGIK